uniref:Palmitoyl-protein thioesterase 1 n=1 Tax=Hirondellea gigas TaxID=1518452 RepID=A0A2P2HZP0_9CRUS
MSVRYLLGSWVLILLFCHGSTYLPVVMWHGMGDSCCNPSSLGYIKKLIENEHNGTYVYSIMIGSSVISDTESGFFKNVNDQIDETCRKIKADPLLADGYHAVGFSQGGLFIRGLAQRCPDPPMKNLVSIGGPQQGVFGVPPCPAEGSKLCEYFRKILHTAAYASWIQNTLVQAEFWHDSIDIEDYKRGSVFLADINQENAINESYRSNLQQLEKLVMVMFLQDITIIPKESAWFGFYAPGQDQKLQTLQESSLYQEDRLGLKIMDRAGRLQFHAVDGQHLHFTDKWFLDTIVGPYFN